MHQLLESSKYQVRRVLTAELTAGAVAAFLDAVRWGAIASADARAL